MCRTLQRYVYKVVLAHCKKNTAQKVEILSCICYICELNKWYEDRKLNIRVLKTKSGKLFRRHPARNIGEEKYCHNKKEFSKTCGTEISITNRKRKSDKI